MSNLKTDLNADFKCLDDAAVIQQSPDSLISSMTFLGTNGSVLKSAGKLRSDITAVPNT